MSWGKSIFCLFIVAGIAFVICSSYHCSSCYARSFSGAASELKFILKTETKNNFISIDYEQFRQNNGLHLKWTPKTDWRLQHPSFYFSDPSDPIRPQSAVQLNGCEHNLEQGLPRRVPGSPPLAMSAPSSLPFFGVKISKLYIHCICILQVNPQLPI